MEPSYERPLWAVRSYEVEPRLYYSKPVVEGETERKPGECVTFPVYGQWTMDMMARLRDMWARAVLIDDDTLMYQIEAALEYLYTRTENRKRGKRKKRKGKKR